MTSKMEVQIYKCFIASPSDTEEERNFCDVAFRDINKTLGELLNFRIESKKWEIDGRPSFGDDGQDVINKQLLNEYHLFIGIMWNRFGSPTNRAESGTEEEFDQAYSKYCSKDDVEIMMYFNTASTESNSLDLDQIGKVRDFKKKVVDLGGFYSEYAGPQDFLDKLKDHLSNYFINKLGSNTDEKTIEEGSKKLEAISLKDSVSRTLKNRLSESLCLFSDQPAIWVEPVLSESSDISKNADDNFDSKIDLNSIISSPSSLIIQSPPQFGLTCLANYLVKQAWLNNSTWVYLDARKAQKNSITKYINKELRSLGLEDKKIDCIVLDSWSKTREGAKKLLRNICHENKGIPVIVMQTIDDASFKNDDENVSIGRSFKTLHLLALPRNQIRKVVCDYNNEKNIGDEDAVLNKVVNELNALNIHRTPLNCITLLKVSEGNFNESPVNRTKMIEMVLFVLFNLDDLPTYKIKPDVKDCEYVLGRFCEGLIRSNNYNFSREGFLYELEKFCEEKLLRLEVSVVFDILYANHIIMNLGSDFIFRASYWIYYFAAKRMYFDKAFKDYILIEKSYVSFPEIIDFYTGIDRDRDELLVMLSQDLSDACSVVEKKTGLPADLNPLPIAHWDPEHESIEKMQEEINKDISTSKLPDTLKDRHADREYDQLRPYNQSIQNILNEYSLTVLIQKIRASSRALRNSDYVDPDIKRSILKEILRGWKEVSKILFALTPVLAEKGRAGFDGQSFVLNGDFGDTVEDRISSIFQSNPMNVTSMFKYDLFSNKLGPLLYDAIDSEKNDLIKHILILLLIVEMPLGWRKYIEGYISDLQKNSFYLFNVVNTLTKMYRFGFASDTQLGEIRLLLKMGFAKHQFGGSKPKPGDIRKISDKVIPKRSADDS